VGPVVGPGLELFICEYLRISLAASALLQQRYHKNGHPPYPLKIGKAARFG